MGRCLSLAALTMAWASGCSEARSTPAASRSSSSASKPVTGPMWVTEGRPSVRVPVLSTTRVLTFSIRSSASAFLMRTPICAPRPTPTMMETGVASPSAHGQAMMRTATATTRACASRGSGPTSAHTANATDRDGDDDGNEDGRDPVRHPLDGCTGALSVGDHLHDAGQHRVASDLLGDHDQRPGLVDGAADDRVAGGLGGRHRLTGHQGLINRGASLFDRTVDRHLLARTDPQPVTELDLIEGHFFVGAVGTDPSGRLRGSGRAAP